MFNISEEPTGSLSVAE